MGNLLINEPPLMVLPSLAQRFGLNEAIVIQQLHYWINKSSSNIDGHWWVYNSVADWHKQFPFWSESTIKRILAKLCDRKVLMKDNFNKAPMDRTSWYTIDYSLVHSDTPIRSTCTNQKVNLTPPIPETTTETTTETTKKIIESVSFDTFWSDYPRKIGKGAARTAFGRALKKATADEIIGGLLKHEIQTMKDAQFIPHPATWLNQERWSDEVVKTTDKPFWGKK